MSSCTTISSVEMFSALEASVKGGTIMLSRNSSRGNGGHMSSSGIESMLPSGFLNDETLGIRCSSATVFTRQTTGPGYSNTCVMVDEMHAGSARSTAKKP